MTNIKYMHDKKNKSLRSTGVLTKRYMQTTTKEQQTALYNFFRHEPQEGNRQQTITTNNVDSNRAEVPNTTTTEESRSREQVNNAVQPSQQSGSTFETNYRELRQNNQQYYNEQAREIIQRDRQSVQPSEQVRLSQTVQSAAADGQEAARLINSAQAGFQNHVPNNNGEVANGFINLVWRFAVRGFNFLVFLCGGKVIFVCAGLGFVVMMMFPGYTENMIRGITNGFRGAMGRHPIALPGHDLIPGDNPNNIVVLTRAVERLARDNPGFVTGAMVGLFILKNATRFI